jgi:asparagine N-glycosylation enzyme membrane subunit Stt3
MADGELGAELSFLALIPMGIVHTVIAAKVNSKGFIPRGRTGLTSILAFASFGVGLGATLAVSDFHVVRGIVAAAACVPALPVAVELARLKSWGALAMAAIVPAVAAVLILA